MFSTYRDIELVVDTQRMDFHKRSFPLFDPYKWLDKVSPFVYLAHYSNARYGEEFLRHIPVLPEHASDLSYGDSYQYLKYLAERNDRFHVTFEHNPKVVSKAELETCYEVVDRLLRS